MKNKKRYFRFAAAYTAVFILLTAGMLLPLLLQKRTLIWNDDAKSQYYLQLAYMGRLLREFFGNLLHGRFVVRMYDFINGMGDDINTLVRFHPLDFLSVFVPEAYTKYLYSFLILLRIYLAGLSFSAFCFYWKKRADAVLIGCMVYISCGYVLKLVTYHPTFGSAVIMLPLLLIGAEEVMRGKRKLLFSFLVFLSFTSNYYFTYMATAALGIYVLLRFRDVTGWSGRSALQRIGDFFRLLFTFAFYYILGTGMAALTLLPIFARLGASPRLSNSIQLRSLWVYPIYRYGAWVLAMISPYMDIGSVTKLNYAVIAAPALALLFSGSRGRHRTLRFALVLEGIFLMLPFFGYIMSGFSNINNRWTYIISFTVAAACVVMAEEQAVFSRLQKRVLLLLPAVFLAAAAVGTVFASRYAQLASYRVYIWIGAGECVLFVGMILYLQKRKASKKLRMRCLAAATAFSCILNGFVTYDRHFGNTAQEFLRNADVPGYYDRLPERLLAQTVSEDEFYRVDTDLTTAGSQNASLYYGYKGIAVYNSVLNARMVQYMLEQENPGQNGIIRLANLDGRTSVENLANVRYLLTRAKWPGSIPWGFERSEELSTEKYAVYENTMPLSFGYTYDSFISRTEYEQLPALERQELLFETALVEDETAQKLEREGTSLRHITDGTDGILCIRAALPQIGKKKRIQQIDGGYLVTRRNARIRIPYEKKAGYECYVRLVGIGYQGPGMVSNHAEILIWNKARTIKRFTVRGEEEAYYLPRENLQICMGPSQKDRKGKLTIRFRKAGTYYLKGIELYYVPVSDTAQKIRNLNEGAMENTRFSINRISGTASLHKEGFMVFSIPWSSGWHAQVDGKDAKLSRANTGYMGLRLPEGEHRIELHYMSPGLSAAVPIAAVCWAAFIALLFLKSVRKKKRRRTAGV